jgi:hypothetical protein
LRRHILQHLGLAAASADPNQDSRVIVEHLKRPQAEVEDRRRTDDIEKNRANVCAMGVFSGDIDAACGRRAGAGSPTSASCGVAGLNRQKTATTIAIVSSVAAAPPTHLPG